jgi:hypothetical protein
MTKLTTAYKRVLRNEVLISLNFLYDFVDVASKRNVSDSYSREACSTRSHGTVSPQSRQKYAHTVAETWPQSVPHILSNSLRSNHTIVQAYDNVIK